MITVLLVESKNRIQGIMKKTRFLAKAAVIGTTATFTLGMGIAPAYSEEETSDLNHSSEGNNSDLSVADNGSENFTDTFSRLLEDVQEDNTEGSEKDRSNDTSNFFGSGLEVGVLANTDDENAGSTETTTEDSEDSEEDEESEIVVGDYVATDHTENLDFQASIVISTSEEANSFTTYSENQTILEILEEKGIPTSEYRDVNGNKVVEEDLDRTLDHGETLLLHSHSRSVESEEVELEHRVEEKETDELYIGESEVEQEGSDGSAVSITLTSGYNGDDERVEERLTVVEAPEREIVLIGTAERPEPTPEPETTNLVAASGEELGEESGSGSNSESGSRPHNSYLDDIDVASFTDEGYETGNDIVDTMLTQIDNRYVWGAESPEAGFDCSGIIWWAYQQNGKSIPRVAEAQGQAGTAVAWDDIQVGDFIWSDYHIGVYMGEDANGTPLMLHALNPDVGIIIDDANAWKNRGFNVSRL